MALKLKWCVSRVVKQCLFPNTTDQGPKCLKYSQILLQKRHSSNQTEPDENERCPRVARSPDGTFMCWHPEPTFPYEHTKPVPRDPKADSYADSVLKVQLLEEHERLQLSRRSKDCKELSDVDLARMFYTYKWHFRPRPRSWKTRAVRATQQRNRKGYDI